MKYPLLVSWQAGVDAGGQPNIMGPPVSRLRQDFPMRPECMGGLVPQQINLWMGAARNGTPSPSLISNAATIAACPVCLDAYASCGLSRGCLLVSVLGVGAMLLVGQGPRAIMGSVSCLAAMANLP